MAATKLNLPNFISTVRDWIERPEKPSQIHLLHEGSENPIKRLRAHDLDGRTADEVAAKIVERCQVDAAAWKGELQTYHVLPFFGQGAQVPEEQYSFALASGGTGTRKGGAPGGVISGDREEVIAELVRQNAELHATNVKLVTIVADWSETRTREDRAEISDLRGERAAVWATMDELRQIDRDAQRQAAQDASDQKRWDEGAALLRAIAGPAINRIVGYKMLPEVDSPMLSQFRGLFDKLRGNVDIFDKMIEATSADPELQAGFVSLFDKFLTDRERTQATAMLVESAKRQLEAKTKEATK